MALNDILIPAILLTELVIGGVLVHIVRRQRELMSDYKTLLDAIDPKKLKEASEYIEKGYEMKHKAIATAELSKMEEQFIAASTGLDKQFTAMLNELMWFSAITIHRSYPGDREMLLGRLPNSEKSLRRVIKEVGDQMDKFKSQNPEGQNPDKAQG